MKVLAGGTWKIIVESIYTAYCVLLIGKKFSLTALHECSLLFVKISEAEKSKLDIKGWRPSVTLKKCH